MAPCTRRLHCGIIWSTKGKCWLILCLKSCESQFDRGHWVWQLEMRGTKNASRKVKTIRNLIHAYRSAHFTDWNVAIAFRKVHPRQHCFAANEFAENAEIKSLMNKFQAGKPVSPFLWISDNNALIMVSYAYERSIWMYHATKKRGNPRGSSDIALEIERLHQSKHTFGWIKSSHKRRHRNKK